MSVLVGKKAPSFKAAAVVNGGEIVKDFSLDQFLGKNHVVFFFYPKDFTFVCPSELHAFQDKLADFEARGAKVIACSTDTEESHWGWLQVPKNKGGIGGVKYPIIADTSKTISEAFGVLAGEYEYDMDVVLQKVKEKWLAEMWSDKRDSYLIVGTQFPNPTFMVLGVFWPPK